MIDKSIYWSKDKILSYNKLWNFVIGARGIGKTYSMTKWCITDYINNGKQSCWGMRYLKELDKAISGFFSEMQYIFEGYEFKIEGYTAYIRYTKDAIDSKEVKWEEFIYFYALSERSLKAISHPNVNKIIFDEFIPIPGVPYLKNEVERFAEYYFTIDRGMRGTRAIFLSNMVTTASPYFSYFHVKVPSIGYISSYDEIAIENCKNEPFANVMKNSRFGKLMKNTHYSDYAIDNESFIDLNTFVIPRDKKAKCLIRIDTSMGKLYIWLYQQFLWISKQGNCKNIVWAVDDASHNVGSERADFAGSLGRRFIRSHYANGTLYFDSDDAKAVFMATCGCFTK